MIKLLNLLTEKIVLDIKPGDVILGGRFKNKKIVATMILFFSVYVFTHSNKKYGGVFNGKSTKVFFQKSEPNWFIYRS